MVKQVDALLNFDFIKRIFQISITTKILIEGGYIVYRRIKRD